MEYHLKIFRIKVGALYFRFFFIIFLNRKIKLKTSSHACMPACTHRPTRARSWDTMPKCFNVKVLNRTKKSRVISTWVGNNLDNSVAKMWFRNYRTFTPPCLRTGSYNVRKGQNEFHAMPCCDMRTWIVFALSRRDYFLRSF